MQTIEDTRVLVILRHELLKMHDSLDVVDNDFKRIPEKMYPPGIGEPRADGE